MRFTASLQKSVLILLGGLLTVLPIGVAGADEALERLARGGHVLMLRHAYAPGGGDPPGFRLGDCSTQRNLDDVGRAQARRIGEALRAAGVSKARVLSSEWCRCLETARLLGFGAVESLPALNSFFDRPQERDARLAAVRAFVERLPLDAAPVILVTHQVTVSGMTGRAVASGEGAVFRLNGTGTPDFVGTVRHDAQ